MKKLTVELIVPNAINVGHVAELIDRSLRDWKFPSSQAIGEYTKLESFLVTENPENKDKLVLVLSEASDTYS